MKHQNKKIISNKDIGIVMSGKEVNNMTPFRKAVLDDGTKKQDMICCKFSKEDLILLQKI